jgi:beta-lactamase regulating signal transducer with metallopeptidase domain
MMPTFVEAALRSLLLACAVWAGLRVFRVRNVVAQKIAWGLVLAAAALMPVLAPWLARVLPSNAAFILPRYSVATPASVEAPSAAVYVPLVAEPALSVAARAHRVAPSSHHSADRAAIIDTPSSLNVQTTTTDAAPALNVRTTEMATMESAAPVSATKSDPAPAAAAPRHLSVSPASLGVALYLSVASALLLRLFYGLASALRLLLTANRIPARESGPFSGKLRLRSSRAVASPVTIGSTVVLPATYREWDREKLRIVVAHERSHIRQGDFYLQFLAGLYAALVWFSPLGWWLKRELSDLAETISDRAGLEEAASTTSYAQILLEFAATPRPTVLGVAMARSGSLSRRIERLLNDHAFRQAFAGGRRRALVAVLLVPIALLATTALIRVQAAQDPQSAPAAKPEIAARPAPAVRAAPADAAQVAAPAPEAEAPDVEVQTNGAVAPEIVGPVGPISPVGPVGPVGSVGPVGPVGPVAPVGPIVALSAPRAPGFAGVTMIGPGAAVNLVGPVEQVGPVIPVGPVQPVGPVVQMAPMIRIGPGGISLYAMAQDEGSRRRHGYRYRYSDDGESYALISGDHSESMNFSGDLHTSEIDKARKLAHGHFLWFEHDDKQYYIDDPAIISQIEAMYKPMEELGRQQEELGKKQEELGRQQEALGRQQEQASLPAPDMQREMAEIDASMARLKAKLGQNITQDELGDLQNKLGDLQGKLGGLQGKIGAKQGEFGAEQGKLGEQQGRLGADQGRLGAEQGRIARDADRKVRSIIDESLQNGKAHPVN